MNDNAIALNAPKVPMGISGITNVVLSSVGSDELDDKSPDVSLDVPLDVSPVVPSVPSDNWSGFWSGVLGVFGIVDDE